MSIFENYTNLYWEFINGDCENEIFKRNGLPYFTIVCTYYHNIPILYYHDDGVSRKRVLKESHFMNYFNTEKPFAIIVMLHSVIFHQFVILFRYFGDTPVLEYIDSQPPSPMNVFENEADTDVDKLYKQYDTIDNYFTNINSKLENLVIQNTNTIYNQFNNSYPPQNLENEIYHNLNQSELLKQWPSGGTCVFWSSMIAVELYVNDLTFVEWMDWFVKTFKNDSTSVKLIDWLRNKLFFYLVQCKRNKFNQIK